MLKRILLLTITCIFFFTSSTEVTAVVSPLTTTNNHYGIHIIDENDLSAAAELVNGNGGEWGYVTLVIRQDELEQDRWQKVFDKITELKLIPIVRLATTMNPAGYWEKPRKEDAQKWATFLNKLNWPVYNRYVILFNEPNHAKEWGGEINPEEYVEVSRAFWEQFKRASDNFYVLPAGFDASAPNSASTMAETRFIEKMMAKDSVMLSLFDGWTSHSYPNPGFSGSPDDSGKMSVRTWEWELDYLKEIGIEEAFPVFITETGWAHNGKSLEVVAQNYQKAYSEAWSDNRVVAVTPFVLSYLSKPFDVFSWKNPSTNVYYPQFEIIKNAPKVRGEPPRDS